MHALNSMCMHYVVYISAQSDEVSHADCGFSYFKFMALALSVESIDLEFI